MARVHPTIFLGISDLLYFTVFKAYQFVNNKWSAIWAVQQHVQQKGPHLLQF